MLGHQFAYSAAPIRKVKEVQFGILSPEEIVSSNFTKVGATRAHPLCSAESLLCREDRIS